MNSKRQERRTEQPTIIKAIEAEREYHKLPKCILGESALETGSPFLRC